MSRPTVTLVTLARVSFHFPVFFFYLRFFSFYVFMFFLPAQKNSTKKGKQKAWTNKHSFFLKKKKQNHRPKRNEPKTKKLNSGRWRSHSAFQASYLSKTPILQDISHTQNQHQVAFCVFWDHTRLCQFPGLVRNRQLYPICSTEAEFISLDAG